MFCSVAPIQQIRILIFTTVNEGSSLWGAGDDLSESEWTEARNVLPAAHFSNLFRKVDAVLSLHINV